MTNTTTEREASNMEQERFKEWALEEGFDLTANTQHKDYFQDFQTHCAWLGWQARAAQAPNKVVDDELVKALKFYANSENWTPQGVIMKTSKSGPFSGGMKADLGETAKEAIEAMGGEK